MTKKETIYDEDVQQCLHYLKTGEEFTFVFDKDKNELCQFNDMSDHDKFSIYVTLTPDWYELTYKLYNWNPEKLKSELERFYEYVKTIDNEFTETAFTILWR